MKKIFSLLLLFFSAQPQAAETLRMSTTTSTENSGLLAVLNPVFEEKHQARIDVISVGTGKALKLGKNGDVDVVFVHAPSAEIAFVEADYGVDRKAVMHNDFVILGPQSDPVQLKSAKSAIEALQMLAIQKAEFISRGDDSGTHKKEKTLWKAAAIAPEESWYIAAGQGMGAVLTIANEKQAYTIADRGTYIAYQDKIDLEIVFEGDPELFNPYHIIAVNPKRYATANYELAQKYIDFITSPEGQAIIGDYKKRGQQLFYPDAL